MQELFVCACEYGLNLLRLNWSPKNRLFIERQVCWLCSVLHCAWTPELGYEEMKVLPLSFSSCLAERKQA